MVLDDALARGVMDALGVGIARQFEEPGTVHDRIHRDAGTEILRPVHRGRRRPGRIGESIERRGLLRSKLPYF